MTGSTATFNTIYKNVALNIENYNYYPRLVGETGGKNYHFVSEDADIDLVVNKTFSAAFDYSGQKCSACSRLYLPEYYYEEFMYKISLLILWNRKLERKYFFNFNIFDTTYIN